MNAIQLSKINAFPSGFAINLPASKSISNRALILHKLSDGSVTINNLSQARDTQILLHLLNSQSEVLDAQDAGTTFRFLTAYCCALNRKTVLTGSERMKQRPIKPLVEALRSIGFSIQYLEADGFPPLAIQPLRNFNNLSNTVEVEASISSQFVSALLLVAPFLPKGLSIKLKGEMVSEPYLILTINMLQQCKVSVHFHNNEIKIAPSFISKTHFEIEPDWSNAFYWVGLCSLLPNSKLLLKDLKLNSMQGDAKAVKFLNLFGVKLQQMPNGLLVTSSPFSIPDSVNLQLNFIAHPDLAQTFMVLCAAKNIRARFTGLPTLKLKETNRVEAMQTELRKCGVHLLKVKNDCYDLNGSFKLPDAPIETYNDHRMAMSFAMLAVCGKVTINAPEVVAKSYPDFWEQFLSV